MSEVPKTSASATRSPEGATIRLAGAADAAAVAAIYRPMVESTPITFELVPPNAAELVERITVKVLPRYPWLVCYDGASCLGYAYATQFRARKAYDWSVEVSVYVAALARRRGIARALYGALFTLLRLQGFRRAIAGVTLPNPASVALHESLGFAFVGSFPRVGFKHGAWHDVGFFSLDLQPDLLDPAPPRTLLELPEGAIERALGLEPDR
ncbi:MAG: N-acetyltransferase [Myxococcales bacterium]|nr:N-acetyltransferase [Myxococcales bacterium]